MRLHGQFDGACQVLALLLFSSLSLTPRVSQTHDHPLPEHLGLVSFPISCGPAAQSEFGRGVALLHSFAYSAAESAFKKVAVEDPGCAMAHWGTAMTYFHQLWDPPITPSTFSLGQREIQRAQQVPGGSDRERRFIRALALFYEQGFDAVPYSERVSRYEGAMAELAAAYPHDTESQVFYGLALLAAESPFDKSHAKQKLAARILVPLFRRYPQHPGIAHYVIHACDNQEMALQGLAAARSYSKIAPSAPHALHMPSHIFTRLGMWSDSIASNQAAQAAARSQGDIGEELHAMDYLVYAYLQEGRELEAKRVIGQLETMPSLDVSIFKIAYAATAMPARYALERQRWAEAANIVPPSKAPPQVIAIAVWARAFGLAKSGHPDAALRETEKLREIERQLHASKAEYSGYWAKQVGIQELEIMAWSAQAERKTKTAESLLRKAADAEDAIEKLPVTPGPVIPAREQLGNLLLEQQQPAVALKEFQAALMVAPKRRGALRGLSEAGK